MANVIGFAPGAGTRDWRGIDFSRQPVELRVDGESVVAKVGSHPSGDEVVAHFEAIGSATLQPAG